MPLNKEVATRICINSASYSKQMKLKLAYKDGALSEAQPAAILLATLESIKQDCKSKGTPMDLVLQVIYNRAEKAVKGYYEQTKIKQS